MAEDVAAGYDMGDVNTVGIALETDVTGGVWADDEHEKRGWSRTLQWRGEKGKSLTQTL